MSVEPMRKPFGELPVLSQFKRDGGDITYVKSTMMAETPTGRGKMNGSYAIRQEDGSLKFFNVHVKASEVVEVVFLGHS